jgi:phytoene synthase
MSDTPNPGNLTSPAAPGPILAGPEAFDARLKAADEPRWLASRYAPESARQLLVAVNLLHGELQRALAASDAMLGKIRVQWWREALAEIAAGKSRRHDLALELSRLLGPRPEVIVRLAALVDAFDDILDDHLHAGGHQPGAEHAQNHLAAAGALARAAGLALDGTATAAQLDGLAVCAEAWLALQVDLPDAAHLYRRAVAAAHTLPPAQWPAILHLAATPPGRELGPLGQRWQVFLAMLRRRL